MVGQIYTTELDNLIKEITGHGKKIDPMTTTSIVGQASSSSQIANKDNKIRKLSTIITQLQKNKKAAEKRAAASEAEWISNFGRRNLAELSVGTASMGRRISASAAPLTAAIGALVRSSRVAPIGGVSAGGGSRKHKSINKNKTKTKKQKHHR